MIAPRLEKGPPRHVARSIDTYPGRNSAMFDRLPSTCSSVVLLLVAAISACEGGGTTAEQPGSLEYTGEYFRVPTGAKWSIALNISSEAMGLSVGDANLRFTGGVVQYSSGDVHFSQAVIEEGIFFDDTCTGWIHLIPKGVEIDISGDSDCEVFRGEWNFGSYVEAARSHVVNLKFAEARELHARVHPRDQASQNLFRQLLTSAEFVAGERWETALPDAKVEAMIELIEINGDSAAAGRHWLAKAALPLCGPKGSLDGCIAAVGAASREPLPVDLARPLTSAIRKGAVSWIRAGRAASLRGEGEQALSIWNSVCTLAAAQPEAESAARHWAALVIRQADDSAEQGAYEKARLLLNVVAPLPTDISRQPCALIHAPSTREATKRRESADFQAGLELEAGKDIWESTRNPEDALVRLKKACEVGPASRNCKKALEVSRRPDFVESMVELVGSKGELDIASRHWIAQAALQLCGPRGSLDGCIRAVGAATSEPLPSDLARPLAAAIRAGAGRWIRTGRDFSARGKAQEALSIWTGVCTVAVGQPEAEVAAKYWAALSMQNAEALIEQGEFEEARAILDIVAPINTDTGRQPCALVHASSTSEASLVRDSADFRSGLALEAGKEIWETTRNASNASTSLRGACNGDAESPSCKLAVGILASPEFRLQALAERCGSGQRDCAAEAERFLAESSFAPYAAPVRAHLDAFNQRVERNAATVSKIEAISKECALTLVGSLKRHQCFPDGAPKPLPGAEMEVSRPMYLAMAVSRAFFGKSVGRWKTFAAVPLGFGISGMLLGWWIGKVRQGRFVQGTVTTVGLLLSLAWAVWHCETQRSVSDVFARVGLNVSNPAGASR
jgi:hypothetical protein